jgi:acyl-CoA hydrolase
MRVILCAASAFDRGRIAFTFALGTQRLYDWMARNRAIASYHADYTNHPQVIARHDNVVSITNAIEVDLYGQVAAESLGPRQISGNSGMLDFVYGSNGAFRAPPAQPAAGQAHSWLGP